MPDEPVLCPSRRTLLWASMAAILFLPVVAPPAQAFAIAIVVMAETPANGALEQLGVDDGVSISPQRIVERTLQFVEDYDPSKPPAEQLEEFWIYAGELSREIGSVLDESCLHFVADPNVLNWVDADLTDMPERLRVRMPFAASEAGDVVAGYLVLAVRLSGEVTCGATLPTHVLS